MAINPAAAQVNTYLKRLIDVQNPKAGTHPTYQAVQAQMELLNRIWMLLPGNGNPMAKEDPEDALAALIGFNVIQSDQEITDAATAVTTAFNEYFGAELQHFLANVGQDTIAETNPVKMFETRRDDEVKEHNGNVSGATDFRTRLVTVADRIKISYVGAPAPAKTQKTAKTKAPGLFLRLFSEPVKPAKGAEIVVPDQEFGWRTPPIFDPNSEDVTMFEMIYPDAMKLEPDAFILAIEASYGVTRDTLQDLFARLYAQCNAQLEQSAKILAFIEKDYKMYQDCMMAGLEFQSKVVDLGKFYGFQIGKPTKKSAR